VICVVDIYMKVCFIGFCSMHCIIYIYIYIYIYKWTLLTVLHCCHVCCMLTEEMEGIFRLVKVEVWEGVVVRLCL